MDCSSPGSFVHGILQARILEWVAMPSSRDSNSFLLGLLHCWRMLSCWAAWEAPGNMSRNTFYKCLLSQIFDKHWTRGSSWTEFSYVQWQGDIYFLLDCTVLKNPCWRQEFNPWVGKIPWSGRWQPTPVSLPGKFHGQRSLAGYSPWGHKVSDTTEQMRQNHEKTPSTINRILFLFFPEGTPPQNHLDRGQRGQERKSLLFI